MSLDIGQVIEGKYRIVRLIGEGGMGAVYEGENTRIQRRVAIKVLHAAFTENDEVVQRFEHEAQAAGRIGNDHILEVLDLGTLDNGDLFLVMEYLDGEPLAARVKRQGSMTPRELAPIAKEVLEGLAAAHVAGIVHRDLKPDNIFILKEKAGRRDFVKIIDFGISKFQPLSSDGMKMTRTGTVMGTPYYMSPEQASGSHEADARSDLYALGVILYECTTGRVPFDAPSFNQLIFKIALSEPPPLLEVVPDVDPGFASIVSKAMARDLGVRFQSAEEFSAALEAWWASGRGVSVPPPQTTDALARQVVGETTGAGGAAPNTTVAERTVSGSGTAGSWTTTPATVTARRRPLGIVAALGAVGLVVLGGGAAGVYAWWNHRGESLKAAGSEAVSVATAPAVVSAAVPNAPSDPVVVPSDVTPPQEEPESEQDEPEAVSPPPRPRAKRARAARVGRAATGSASKPATHEKPAAPAKTAEPTVPDFGY